MQAQAMVEIVKQLGWSYVSTVAAQVHSQVTLFLKSEEKKIVKGEYGEKGISSFIQLATKSGICIGVSVTINRNADDKEFDKVVETLLSKEKAKVSRDGLRTLLTSVSLRLSFFLWTRIRQGNIRVIFSAQHSWIF